MLFFRKWPRKTHYWNLKTGFGEWAWEIQSHINSEIYWLKRWSWEGDGTALQYSCLKSPMDGGAWWAAVPEVAKSQTRLSDFTFTFHFHALEKAMATHSSVLAWRISGTAEPGGLQSMGLHRVRHDWSSLAARLVIVFLPRSKCLLISWLQSSSAVILLLLLSCFSRVWLCATP